MTGYRVADGTQVNINGLVYAPGEALPELPADRRDKWQALGWIVPTDDAAPAQRRSRSATA